MTISYPTLTSLSKNFLMPTFFSTFPASTERIICWYQAIRTMPTRPRGDSFGVDYHHHHHEGEEHEEGHQARHGCQYVVCSHSSSWVILYWGPSGREIILYSYKFLLSPDLLTATRLQLGNKSWKSHELIRKYCTYEKVTNNKDYLQLVIKILFLHCKWWTIASLKLPKSILT